MSRRNGTLTAVWVCLLGAACSSALDSESTSELSEHAIYGADNRYEYSAITDPDVKRWADGTAAMFRDANVQCAGGTCQLTTTQLKVTGFFSPPAPLCSDQRFYGQLTGAFCTSFLIGPDTMMTAGHCIDAVPCSDFHVVFGFTTDAQGQALSSVPASDVYQCVEVVDTLFTGGTSDLDKDWAIIRLDRAVGPAPDQSPRLPLPLRSTGYVQSNAQLVAVGHGLGLPLKLADDGQVVDNEPNFPRFYSTVDTFGGNSGSAVVDLDLGLVEGILVTGYSLGYNWRPGASPSCYEASPCSEDPADEDCGGVFAGVMRIRDAVDGAACNDGLQGPRETGSDCGGPCLPCELGEGCQTDYDCTTLHCENAVCGAPTCDDDQKNGTESGVDCGGSCPDKCGYLEGCSSTEDCQGHLMCNVPHAPVCVWGPPSRCANGVKDNHETDVDCGGKVCPACTENKGCEGDADCAYSFMCVAGICRHSSTCSDGVKASLTMESDVDSGGMCQSAALGQRCYSPRDCGRGPRCLAGICSATSPVSCTDGVASGSETDVDCGGACSACGALKRCAIHADCASGLNCALGYCRQDVANHCYSGVVNGNETDEDCGGSCGVCHAGQGCGTDADCATNLGLRCLSGVCAVPAGTCSDGVKNGVEGGLDCGGPFCPLCGNIKMCDAGDCAASLVCAGDSFCLTRPTF